RCHLLRRFGDGLSGRVAAGTGKDVESEIATPFDPLVVLFGEHRSDQSDQCSPVGEDPDHIGATPDLLVQPLLYPALRVGSTPDCRFGSAVEPLQVVGQRVSDAMVTGRFIGPSSV